MPFVSQAQQGWAHTHPEEFGRANLKEFDAATKGEHDLPAHVHKGHPVVHASYHLAHEARKSKEAK
jgi:hypothetical protein